MPRASKSKTTRESSTCERGPSADGGGQTRRVSLCDTTPAVGKRQIFMCLSCGTSLEQIAAESLTHHLFEFVHGDIWRHPSRGPQDRVAGQIRLLRAAPTTPQGRAD